AVLTSAGPDLPLADLLPGIEVHLVESAKTTRIRNIYGEDRRRQFVPQRAAELTAEHRPNGWSQTPVVLLGPVMGEVQESLARCFSGSLIGAGAQGWLRKVAANKSVRQLAPAEWDARPILRHSRVLFISDEDVPRGEVPPALQFWSGMVQTIAFTRGYGGADVGPRGEWRHIDAFPVTRVVDPTGAGDVFAAAFLIRLRESGDVWRATRFAACAASFTVEGYGTAAIPDRERIEARLREHPDIRAA
ncbi:MAG: PfkB family carbohydrate kinase, partial [bacterium]